MIKVKVEEPRVQRVKVGSDVTFVCTATSKVSNYCVIFNCKIYSHKPSQ